MHRRCRICHRTAHANTETELSRADPQSSVLREKRLEQGEQQESNPHQISSDRDHKHNEAFHAGSLPAKCCAVLSAQAHLCDIAAPVRRPARVRQESLRCWFVDRWSVRECACEFPPRCPRVRLKSCRSALRAVAPNSRSSACPSLS